MFAHVVKSPVFSRDENGHLYMRVKKLPTERSFILTFACRSSERLNQGDKDAARRWYLEVMYSKEGKEYKTKVPFQVILVFTFLMTSLHTTRIFSFIPEPADESTQMAANSTKQICHKISTKITPNLSLH